MSQSSKQQLLHNFLEWVRQREDIRAAALVGSSARVDHPADEWSDFDLIIVAEDAPRYLVSTNWLAEIGSPWASILEKTTDGEPLERRVLFAGGHDMDFFFLSAEDARQDFQNMPIVFEILQRGIRVLVDKDNLLSTLAVPQVSVLAAQPPSIQTFEEVVNDFWFHAAWTTKKLRRGELWVAKSCCDHYLKGLLLRMMEWEAKAVHGWEYDTWFNGRFLEEWALPETLAELSQVYAHYQPEDVWRALEASMRVFRRTAKAVAESLGFAYPIEIDERVSAWVSQMRIDK